MTQVVVTLNKELDKVVGIIKSMYGFSSKNKAIQFIIRREAEELLEKELRPEFVQRILRLERTGRFKKYASLDELRDEVEYA
ncbi:MAG: DUF2683 family protein [Candidatus Diapherotrites archaeon]|nr:DUF2683 family protein [Candidatus Diapherotrites archaeon]